MDLASLLGMIIGFVLVVFGILQSAGSVSGLVWFLDYVWRSRLCNDDLLHDAELCRRFEKYRIDI